MNNIVIGVIVAALGLGGLFVYVSAQERAQKEEKMQMEEKAMMEKQKMEMEQKEMMEKEAMMKAEGDDSMMKKEGVMEGDAMMKKDEAMMKEEKVQGAMISKGSYEAYDASKLSRADEGDVVLFFRASWCPSCKALDADIRAHESDIKPGLSILEVDYDTQTALKQKYGVTLQHTLVQVDVSGNLIAKWSGSPTLAGLMSKVQ